jgi:23S rRNA (pseudouridine1915-N3)-methyltransferase
MLDIIVLTIGKIKDKNLVVLEAEYLKRLKPFARVKLVELPAASFAPGTYEAAKRMEAERISEFLHKEENRSRGATAWLLAERGLDFKSSPDLAAWLNKKNPLILVIGGALGFSAELYGQYPQISLSPLTLPHELARVVLLEQLYRATTIINKKDYHY